jgi:glycogen(starch) synthase
MPVRVLVVSNMYPPHHLGGYELSCRDTVERFRTRGHDVAVLTSTMRRPEVVDPSGERDAGIRRDLLLYWRDHELLRPPRREQVRVERHNQRVLIGALEEVEPEVVSFWNMGAVSMGVLTTVVERGIPTVLVVCDNWLVYGPLVDPWAARFARRGVLAAAARRLTGVPTAIADLDRVEAACFVSESTRRTAVDNTPWSFPRSIVTYSGVERADFAPPDPEEEMGPWRGRLLYVGRVEARKGVETAVRALAGLPQSYTLEILGPGDPPYVADLHRLAESLGVGERVRFDTVERAALRSRYLAADAVVFPSEWEEPFGLVPLEAMACGRPVVATAMGGSAEFLADGVNCVIFGPGDAQGLAVAVRRLADDESLRRRLVQGGLATASGFDTDRLADVLEEWHVAAARRFRDGVPLVTAPRAAPPATGPNPPRARD